MLKSLLHHRIARAAGTLMQAPADLSFDFSEPRGEAALVPADSVSWRIFKNPLGLFIGGVAAVILELAEPSVRTGVWEHSSFRHDPVTRLRRTGFAAMMTVYGPRRAAEQMIAHVVTIHQRVRGTTPSGQAYHANDQRLLDWVQATASFGFINAYHIYVSPLSDAERSQAFAEGAEAARLYGALGAPTSLGAWDKMLEAMASTLEPSPIVFEFLAIMHRAPILPVLLRPLQALLLRAAVEMTPPGVRQKLGLDSRYGLGRLGAAFVRLLGRSADRLPLYGTPPTLASVRMGLAEDSLYRPRP